MRELLIQTEESERNYFAVFKEEMVTKLNNKYVKFNPYV